MKERLDPKKLAIIGALIFGILHTIGVILILTGVGRWFGQVHFIAPDYSVLPFNASDFFLGILAAVLVGAVVGWLSATIYNAVSRR